MCLSNVIQHLQNIKVFFLNLASVYCSFIASDLIWNARSALNDVSHVTSVEGALQSNIVAFFSFHSDWPRSTYCATWSPEMPKQVVAKIPSRKCQVKTEKKGNLFFNSKFINFRTNIVIIPELFRRVSLSLLFRLLSC